MNGTAQEAPTPGGVGVKVSRIIGFQEITDWFTTAIEGGSHYWCDGLSVATGNKAPETGAAYPGLWYANVEFWQHPEFRVRAIVESYPEYTGKLITRKKLIRGLRTMANKHPKTTARLVSEDYDANDADVFLQYTLFNEEVFG